MGCTCTIDVDHDGGPTAYSETNPVARKAHRCTECHEEIKPGERYERAFGVWDGEPLVYKTCLKCAEVRGAFFCNWVYGMLWEDLEESIRENFGAYSDECLRSISPSAREMVFATIEAVWADLAEYDDDDE